MNLSGAEVGVTRRIRSDFVPEGLELATANVGEVFPIRTRCCTLVEVNRNLQLAADAIAKAPGERDAIIHRRALERNEWHDVSGTESWVLTGVDREIDEVACLRNAGVRSVG